MLIQAADGRTTNDVCRPASCEYRALDCYQLVSEFTSFVLLGSSQLTVDAVYWLSEEVEF